MQLKSLTYTSWAKPSLGETDVEAILASARRRNPVEGITGVLIFNGGAFIQVLEGESGPVDAMTERIRSDPRHFNMFVRDERPVPERAFSDWSMGFVRVESGGFDGEQAVAEALRSELPEPTRKLILALTSTIARQP